MKQTRISKLHGELLQLKAQALQVAQVDFQRAVNEVALEMGMDLKETWSLSADMKFFEKPNEPTPMIPPEKK
jgi:hypothetical protein